MELAELKGSEKQVSWAKAIRKDRFKVWQATDSDSFEKVASMLSQQSVSSWWIASKDKSLREICSQLQGGAKPPAPKTAGTGAGKRAVSGGANVVGMERVAWVDDGELWETVTTATGFTRSGPTRDVVTGEIVTDAALPF